MTLSKFGRQTASDGCGLPTNLMNGSKSIQMHLGRDWGLNSPMGGGNTLADGYNLSPREGSIPAVRLPRRAFVNGYGEGVSNGMIIFNGALVFARGNGIYSTTDGTTIYMLARVRDTYKNFVIFGDRLYIYPDKLFLERGGMPRSLELDTGVLEDTEFKDNTIRLPVGYYWSDFGFEPGDGLQIVKSNASSPAPAGYYHILSVQDEVATLSQNLGVSCSGGARFKRVVPDLTACCVCGDRLYGVSGKNIHVSAAGSATDFYSSSTGDGTHPATLSCDAEGDFTALSPWQGYIVCFKADRICRLLGNRADSFTLQDRQGVGIPASLSHTLCEVGDALYYASEGGVWRYRGQEPEWVCSFGGATAKAGCGGTDGRAYYLSFSADGQDRMSLYLPESGKWYPEDNTLMGSMLCHNGLLWMQGDGGIIWTTASDGRAVEGGVSERDTVGEVFSSMTLVPDRADDPAKIRPTALWIRATGRSGSLRVYASYADGGAEMDASSDHEIFLAEFSAPMSDRLLFVPVLAGPCDAATLRLEMDGEWVIHDVIRRYEVART